MLGRQPVLVHVRQTVAGPLTFTSTRSLILSGLCSPRQDDLAMLPGQSDIKTVTACS